MTQSALKMSRVMTVRCLDTAGSGTPESGGGHTRRQLLAGLPGALPAAALALGTNVRRPAAASAAGPFAVPAAAAGADLPAVYCPETGHHLRSGFLAYWRAHQGPRRLGFPLSEEHWDQAAGAMVQPFPQARLEWRPGSPGGRDLPGDWGGVREVAGVPASGATTPGVARVPRDPGVPDWSDALAPSPPVVALPGTLRQGRTLLVEIVVDDSAAPLTVSGSLGLAQAPGADPAAVALRCFPVDEPDGTRFRAFAGLSVDAPPGQWALTVAARNGLALEAAPAVVGVQVVDGGFTLQRLAFAADLLLLLDPSVGEQERLTLAAVMAESAPAPRWRGRFQLPVTGRLVTAHGARRDYLSPDGSVVAHSQHGGVDLAAPAGTPIAAPAAGVVAFAGRWSIRGNVVVLDHGAGVHTVHAHAASLAVAPGQAVTPGQALGYVGSTGLSTGPHLHWEVRVGGIAVEPLEWTQRPELGLV
jgi:murein DD-endopeptidase MepM/ murein hydrolase activator NlpD